MIKDCVCPASGLYAGLKIHHWKPLPLPHSWTWFRRVASPHPNTRFSPYIPVSSFDCNHDAIAVKSPTTVGPLVITYILITIFGKIMGGKGQSRGCARGGRPGPLLAVTWQPQQTVRMRPHVREA